MSESIYRFFVDCGRMGDLDGVFVADDDRVAKVIDKTVTFYEVLGKHSEIDVDLSWDNLTKVEANPEFVAKFAELKLGGGINPLDYIEEDQESDEEE